MIALLGIAVLAGAGSIAALGCFELTSRTDMPQPIF